jgi:ribosomal protein S19
MLQLDVLKLTRNKTIKAKYLGKIIQIHNGKKYCDFLITKQMLNYKTGCFIPTRSDFFYKKSK